MQPSSPVHTLVISQHTKEVIVSLIAVRPDIVMRCAARPLLHLVPAVFSSPRRSDSTRGNANEFLKLLSASTQEVGGLGGGSSAVECCLSQQPQADQVNTANPLTA